MIRIFYTPLAYRDATALLLGHAIRQSEHPDYSKILYISPAAVKAEEARKIFHRIQGNKCYIPPELTTLGGYCSKLYSSCGGRRVLRRPLIPLILAGQTGKGLGFSSLAAAFISDLKQRFPGMDAEAVGPVFTGMFREADVPDAVAGGVMSVLDIFARYQAFIRDNGLIDEDGIMNDVSVALNDRDASSVMRNELTDKDKERGLSPFTDDAERGRRGVPEKSKTSWGAMGTVPGDPYSSLVVDGIYDVTAAEKNVLKALIRSAEAVYISIPEDAGFSGLTKDYISFLRDNFRVEEIYLKNRDALCVMRNEYKDKESLNSSLITHHSSRPSEDASRITHYASRFVYYAYPDMEEEVEGIARNIKALFAAGRLKRLEEVTVVFPDLSGYAAMVGRIFRRYGIPHVISSRKSLGELKPFLDVLCLIGSVAGDYPRLKFSQFLASRYFSRMPGSLVNWIPSLSPRSGIVSGKSAWLDFIIGGSEAIDVELLHERPTIEKDLRWVFDKLQPLEDIKNGAPLSVFAASLRKILADLGFPGDLTETSGDSPGVSSAKELADALDDIFDQIAFLGTVSPAVVAISGFEEALHHLLRSAYLEERGSGVRVMDFTDVQGLAPEYLFFGGLSDRNLPKRRDIDYILPDALKMKLGLLHFEKYNRMQKFAFEGITAAGGHLHLSYPLMDGDAVFLPSSFLYGGEERKERIPGIFSYEEQLVRTGGASLLDYIPEIRAHTSLLKSPAYLRVTDVDAYRGCPRRFFIERELGLAPLSVKEYEVEAATLGIIVHKVMERLVKEPLGDIDALTVKAEAMLDEIMATKKMNAYWKRLIRDTFIGMLPAIYEKELEIRAAGYVSSETEKSVSGEPLKGVRLKGKIDRIDKVEDGFQIMDYKTGTAGLNCSRIASGNESLQLLLYAAIMKSHGYAVRRVGIYSLKDMHVKWCPPKRKARGRGKDEGVQTIEDYITVSLGFLADVVARMKKGDFSAEPLNDYSCWNCHEHAFCPYIQQ